MSTIQAIADYLSFNKGTVLNALNQLFPLMMLRMGLLKSLAVLALQIAAAFSAHTSLDLDRLIYSSVPHSHTDVCCFSKQIHDMNYWCQEIFKVKRWICTVYILYRRFQVSLQKSEIFWMCCWLSPSAFIFCVTMYMKSTVVGIFLIDSSLGVRVLTQS